jgi:hypothetical protein
LSAIAPTALEAELRHRVRHRQIEDVEIAEEGREHCIDHAEGGTAEIRSCREHRLQSLEPVPEQTG